MRPSTFIARRYAQPRNNARFLSFVSLVALLGIALGSAALIVSMAVLDGFEHELKNNAFKFSANIQVSGFDEAPIPNEKTRREGILNVIPNVKAIAPYVSHHAVVRAPDYIEGIVVRGIVPEMDVSTLRDNITDGRFDFSAPDAYEMIVGKKLARQLGVGVGDNIVIYALVGDATAMALPIIEQFEVVGIYETGMAVYDDLYVYAPFDRAATLFRLPEGAASGFDILVNDLDRIDETANLLDDLMLYPFFSRTVFDTYAGMFAWIELQKEPIPLVLGLISIVAVFNVIATLLMLVIEKIRSIGILRALGMTRADIRRIFLFQGLTLGAAGTLAGCVLGFALCWIQAEYHVISLQGELYFLDAVPIRFVPWHYAIVSVVGLALSFAATLIPAAIAARIKPLRALRFS